MSTASHAPIIEFQNVSYKLANGNRLLTNLNLAVNSGETLVLLGRSGAGKTTALKLINRLLDPSEGRVRVEARDTREWNAISLRRHIGYVIQDAGLFPHYTVEENVGVVPALNGDSSEKIRKRTAELLHLVGLPSQEFAKRYPHQLSGGQRQRVGVSRARRRSPDSATVRTVRRARPADAQRTTTRISQLTKNARENRSDRNSRHRRSFTTRHEDCLARTRHVTRRFLATGFFARAGAHRANIPRATSNARKLRKECVTC